MRRGIALLVLVLGVATSSFAASATSENLLGEFERKALGKGDDAAATSSARRSEALVLVKMQLGSVDVRVYSLESAISLAQTLERWAPSAQIDYGKGGHWNCARARWKNPKPFAPKMQNEVALGALVAELKKDHSPVRVRYAVPDYVVSDAPWPEKTYHSGLWKLYECDKIEKDGTVSGRGALYPTDLLFTFVMLVLTSLFVASTSMRTAYGRSSDGIAGFRGLRIRMNWPLFSISLPVFAVFTWAGMDKTSGYISDSLASSNTAVENLWIPLLYAAMQAVSALCICACFKVLLRRRSCADVTVYAGADTVYALTESVSFVSQACFTVGYFSLLFLKDCPDPRVPLLLVFVFCLFLFVVFRNRASAKGGTPMVPQDGSPEYVVSACRHAATSSMFLNAVVVETEDRHILDPGELDGGILLLHRRAVDALSDKAMCFAAAWAIIVHRHRVRRVLKALMYMLVFSLAGLTLGAFVQESWVVPLDLLVISVVGGVVSHAKGRDVDHWAEIYELEPDIEAGREFIRIWLELWHKDRFEASNQLKMLQKAANAQDAVRG